MSLGRPQINPEIVDAMLLAARGATVDRSFLMSDLPRMGDFGTEQPVHARLKARFHMLEARPAIAGKATGTVRLICQRCLGQMDVLIEDEFHVVLVNSEAEMDQLIDEQDVIVANASQLDLAWLIEEQILLAMPLVPLHATTEQCQRRTNEHLINETVAEVVPPVEDKANKPDDNQRPFANLRDLLNKR